ncbi:MAG: hypothetical protein JWP52_340, partial [Rhizobacter sp.]|nr:hypothetical protein [Rhizobacter sp.]
MKSMHLLTSACAAACVAFSPLADAAVFEGSFSGVATGSRIGGPGPDPQNFDGEAVTGTFRVDTAS